MGVICRFLVCSAKLCSLFSLCASDERRDVVMAYLLLILKKKLLSTNIYALLRHLLVDGQLWVIYNYSSTVASTMLELCTGDGIGR